MMNTKFQLPPNGVLNPRYGTGYLCIPAQESRNEKKENYNFLKYVKLVGLMNFFMKKNPIIHSKYFKY